jgi:hypothetical protein
MGSIFVYLGLALEIGSVVEGFVTLAKTEPASQWTGAQISALASPAVSALTSAFPGKINIPPALVTDLSNAVADALQAYFKKAAAPAAA